MALLSPVAVLAEALVLAMAASWAALVLHELGHAMAARLVHVRLWGIRLGMGPTIWHGSVRGVQVHLALFPILGAVHLLDEDASTIGYRDITRGRWRFVWGPEAWRAPVISAGGGLSNLVALMILIFCWEAAGQPGPGTFTGELLLITMGANLAGYLNLLPCFRSDGNHLLAHVRAARLGPAAAVSD